MTQGVWAGVSHRYCLRHIVSNYAKYDGTTKAEKDLVWQAGAELQKRVAKAFLDNLKEVNPGGYNYLHDPQGSNPALTRDKWCLSYDGGVRWGTLTTNISESYNNVLKRVRHLPITALIQGTLTKTVALFAARVEQGNRWSQDLPRRIWAEYEKKDKSAKRHRPQLYDSTNLVYRIQTKYEANLARGRRNYTVRYRDQSCSCGMWQMYRRPCSHALTVCRFRRENPLHMYNVVYHSETFRAQYAHGFLPMRDADEWSQPSWTLRADETRFLITDKEALISFKSQLNIDLSINNTLSDWSQDSLSPCNWTGVSCNNNDQRVTYLDLSGLKLVGPISPSIGNLSFLRSLQLQNNLFTGSLPDNLGNLVRLRVLNASSNSLSGAIPGNISRCKALEIIDLMQNQIPGEIPREIGELKELQVLNLASNHLSGPFPSSVVNISSLERINLGTNSLSGPIPGDISKLGNLQYLDLTINNFSGTVPASIYNMSSLVYLALASNDLWGEIPYNVGQTLPNLLGFNFCFNRFTGRIPGSLQNLTRIKIIRMAHNLLHGSVPPGLGNLPDLEMYNIRYNNIVSSGKYGFGFLESLTNSTRLKFLAIDSNLLEGEIPESIGNLSRVLQKFYMGGNRVFGSIPSSISQLKGLESLDMNNDAISGEIPPEIGQLENLQFLGLSGNLLQGNIPDSLGNLVKLNRIDLSRNNFQGSIPGTFRSFQTLISMDLSYNNLNGTIPPEILRLSNLGAFLNLSRNSLTGTMPEEIGLLENIVTIDISGNRISGDIPNSIGNCKSLQHLSLSENLFSGQIPNTLADVKGLESLDLSSNRLSGSVPFSLQNLQALHFLNLSFNNLEGEVPLKGVFADPSKVHLEGNKNICHKTTCQNTRSSRRTRTILLCIIIPALVFAASIALLLHFKKRGKAKIQDNSESTGRQHEMVSYGDLRLATNDFNPGNLIGTGSFGSVFKGMLRNGALVAVKVIKTRISGSQKSFLAECAALRNVRHRNLIKLITICSSIDFNKDEFLALVYEFMSNGSLKDWITGRLKNPDSDDHLRFNLLDRLNVAIDVASAINYLHHESGNPIVHCDLKPSNILLDSDMTAKVGDFGLARLIIKNMNGDDQIQTSISSTHTLKGSIGYIPPEYGFGEKPSTAGDVYSFGIVLLQLFTGKSPRDESFNGGLSLKKWVQMNFPDEIDKVLDQEICQNDELEEEETQHQCLVQIMGIGLSCAADSPQERLSMQSVLPKLKALRDSMMKPNSSFKVVKYGY